MELPDIRELSLHFLENSDSLEIPASLLVHVTALTAAAGFLSGSRHCKLPCPQSKPGIRFMGSSLELPCSVSSQCFSSHCF